MRTDKLIKKDKVFSTIASSEERRDGMSLPSVPVLKEVSAGKVEASPAVQQRHDVTQLYEDGKLQELYQEIIGATSSGAEVLLTNKAAQEELAGNNDGGKQLTPYFTSMGFEVEFAQQPHENQKKPDNPLTKAHVIVSQYPGYALYSGLNFIIETDASYALEFVSPPLLAPLVEGDEAVTPVKEWENNARKAIEFSLRDISSKGNKSLGEILREINSAFGLILPVPGDYEDIVYGNINKFGTDSATNAQLNFMTTLENFMTINRGAKNGGDSYTEAIYQKAKNYALDEIGDNGYLYALCQKIREIPSTLVDETFSILLHHDSDPDDEISKNKSNKKIINTAKEDESVRKNLASAASHIKDSATLWLKASFHQILAAMSEDKYNDLQPVLANLAENDSDWIVDVLKDTDEFNALLPFYDKSVVKSFIKEQLLMVKNIPEMHYKVESHVKEKPEEQRTVSGNRRAIIGGRPDTYAPADEDIHDEALFLVETRDTTNYLGLTKSDRYKP